MTRQHHDCAHRMAIRLLGVIASVLREEEHRDFYEEAMAVLGEELEALEVRQRRQAARLAPTETPNQRGNIDEPTEHL